MLPHQRELRPTDSAEATRTRRRCRVSLVVGDRLECSSSLGDREHADVAQLVEHHLAKVRVAGSNPVVRSEAPIGVTGPRFKISPAARRRSGRVA